jgi:hypothetical protein
VAYGAGHGQGREGQVFNFGREFYLMKTLVSAIGTLVPVK